MVVSDNGASSEGGPNGMININLWHNNLPGTVEDNLAVLDELGGPEAFQPLCVGLDIRRQHAFPPLEAGDLPRRHLRSAHRHWPTGIEAQDEVRTQYVHAIDLVPTVLDCLGIEPPATIRGVTQSPSKA